LVGALMILTSLNRLLEARGLDKGVGAVVLHVKLALATNRKTEGVSEEGVTAGRPLERHFR
jgi:hypothetical protein